MYPVATVSKVINHKDSEISNETRQRVLSVIKEYQYTPYANIQASFQTFHRQTIAFLTEKNSAVSKYVFDIEKNVSKAGYSLIVCTVDTPTSDSIRKHMKLLDARKAGGILLGLSDSRLIEEAAALNYSHIPMISVSSSISNVCSTFLLDYKAVSAKAVKELIRLGHKSIGCIVDPGDSDRRRRLHRRIPECTFFPFPLQCRTSYPDPDPHPWRDRTGRSDHASGKSNRHFLPDRPAGLYYL